MHDELVAVDAEAFARHISPALVVTDRRAGRQSEVSGDAMVHELALHEGRGNNVDWEILATRGRCGVVRQTRIGASDDGGEPWQTECLVVYELDTYDRCVRIHFLGAADGPAAFATLNEWTHGANTIRAADSTDARHVALWERFAGAAVDGDWETFAATTHPDVVYIDHRAGLHTAVVGRDDYVRGLRDSFGAHDIRHDAEIVATRGEAGVCRSTIFGGGDEAGGDWETIRTVLYEFDDIGLLTRMELFDVGDHHAALEQLDMMTSRDDHVRSAPGVDGRFVRCLEAIRTAIVSKHWDEFERLMSRDVVVVDRRAGLRAEYHGPPEYARVIRESYGERDFDWSVEILSARGDAGVFVSHWSGAGDEHGGAWDTERLVYITFDDHERMTFAELFERWDIDAALARFASEETTHLNAATGSDPFDAVNRDKAESLLTDRGRSIGVHAQPAIDRRIVAFIERFRASLVNHDWQLLEALWSNDALYADRRAGLRFELHGNLEIARVIRESFGTREFDYHVDFVASRGSACVYFGRFSGPGDDRGGPWEAERLTLVVLDQEDRIVVGELFDVGNIDGAFRSLRDHVGGGVRTCGATAAAHVTAWARFRNTLPAGDWDGFASALHPDLIHIDRRSGLHSVITGRDEYVRVMSDSFGRRARDYDIEIVTTRGDAGVIRSTFFGPADDLGGPWETARVVFYALADDGRFLRFDLFDVDDLDGAITALREHAGGSTADLVERFIAAYNARDWSELEAVLDPDLELDDHRAIGWGQSNGVDEFFVRIQAGLGAAGDARVSIATWLRRADDVVLFDMPMRGHVVDVGGDFELDRLVLVRATAGRIRRMELFDAQDHKSALSRFEELAEPY
jgi:hypothetical protein